MGKIDQEIVQPAPTTTNVSFEEVILEITKPPPKPSKVLRKCLWFKTTVESHPEFLAELE